MADPKWVTEAKSFIGLHEYPGAANNPTIMGWLAQIKATWLGGDAAPWCGTFMAHCILAAGLTPPDAPYRAKSWLNWGIPISAPLYGCIVVFNREGGGHVGIVVGRTAAGNLVVLGGNQGDAVNTRVFSTDRVAGYRVPLNYAAPQLLPVVSSVQNTTGEA